MIARTRHFYDRVGRHARSLTTNAAGEVLTDFQWDYNDASEVTAVKAMHLNGLVGVGNDARSELLTESLPGNSGGTTAPPFTNDIIGLPTGNESIWTSDVPATPRVILSIPARNASYTYSPNGNRLTSVIDGVTTTYTYNSANQLTNESAPGKTVSHTYDEWGNESVRTTIQGGTTTETYGYNYLNQLSSYTNSATSANWQYDAWPTGERQGKINLGTGGGNQYYVPRFGDVAAEYGQVGGPVQNRYVQGLGLDQKSTRIPASGGRKHFMGDSVGTVSMTLDDAGATSETTYRDAWGQLIAGSTSERYGFAQRELDSESGLVHVRARMYDPARGRFTQTDPLLGRRSGSHYLYGSNRPASRIDRLGLQDEGPPIERVAPQGQKYICRCSRNILGELFEWAGLDPNVGRNLVIWCVCHIPKEKLLDVQSQLATGYGGAIAEGSLQTMRVTNPGVAAAAFVAESTTERTLEIESRQIGQGEAALRLGADVAAYAVFRVVGDKLVQVAAVSRASALTKVSPRAAGSERPSAPLEGSIEAYQQEWARLAVKERVAEIKAQLGSSADFGETYAVAVLRGGGDKNVHVVVASAASSLRRGVEFKPGETYIGRLFQGKDAEVKTLLWAEHTESSVLVIGATRDICPGCHAAIRAEPNPIDIVTPIKERGRWRVKIRDDDR